MLRNAHGICIHQNGILGVAYHAQHEFHQFFQKFAKCWLVEIISVQVSIQQKQLHQGFRLNTKQTQLFLIGLCVTKYRNQICNTLRPFFNLVRSELEPYVLHFLLKHVEHFLAVRDFLCFEHLIDFSSLISAQAWPFRLQQAVKYSFAPDHRSLSKIRALEHIMQIKNIAYKIKEVPRVIVDQVQPAILQYPINLS